MTKLVVTLMGGGAEAFPGGHTFRTVEDWLIVYSDEGDQIAAYAAHRVVKVKYE